MKEFDYELDYKNIDFKDERNRKLYRIGRGEQGVLLVRPYTNTICDHWRFKTPREMIAHDDWKEIYANFYDLENCELDIPIGETTNDLNSLSAEEQIQEVIKCAKNFYYFCHN